MAEKKTNGKTAKAPQKPKNPNNPMRGIRVEKVTLNMGVGEAGQKLENARTLLQRLTGRTPATTQAKIRSPTWKIKKGDPIGAKVTLRGAKAEEILVKALATVDKLLNARSFDRTGNFSFGVKEYIDFPGAKYDPKIGMAGFDVCVTLSRKGSRVKQRRRSCAPVGKAHLVSRDEAQKFACAKFGVQFAEQG